MIRNLLALGAMTAIVLTPACAQESRVATTDRAEIEQIVREYILANPEIIEEAIVTLTEKQRIETAAAQKEAIGDHKDRLFRLASDPSIGPDDAKVTVVEFFDYRCGFCKRSVDMVQGLPKAYDGNVRVVFKELPIFGGISETASLAALAAGKQGKYREMHVALMGLKSNDDLTEKKIDEIASEIGISVKKMRADMKSMDIQKQLADMKALGRDLQVGGTPGFFVGDTHIEGADTDKLTAAIKAELAS
ncbi:DsbA family protein [Hyphomonas johnsonii]|jgi:protein-disulfide isomerase|uniref:Outer membrane protein n=1 Tax=Hyphomonas johnsonii MHS-2 TaxID=1280950 RepID=A0A059FAN6_9PROT|nr:DsbA family protein [Hyphomonas johnsonii]KCZ87611.1 outer membrane protein [Hyphomonas johnsonii MHS-2]